MASSAMKLEPESVLFAGKDMHRDGFGGLR
jgi:hypothetical protein